MIPEHNDNSGIRLHLTIAPNLISLFNVLLAQGFMLHVQTGCSVRDLMCLQLGVNPDYFDHRIQTIFLDGKAVDDAGTAVIEQDSTLALSAAMPGLAGATFRRGGVYSAMRSQISYDNKPIRNPVTTVTLTLKLFNLVALELGPMFLKQGIRISGKNMENFFKKNPDHFRNGCRAAEINGSPRDINQLTLMEWKDQRVFLKVTIKDKEGISEIGISNIE